MMNRSRLNFIIDAAALVAFLMLAVTGVLIRYTLPPGTGGWAMVWGLNRHEWGTIHFWASVVFFGILLFHIILHFRWIVCMVKGQKTEGSWRRLILGLIGLGVLILFLLAPLLAPVETRNQDRPQHGQGYGMRHERQ